MEITEFLLARIAEDEATAARAAHDDAPWRFDEDAPVPRLITGSKWVHDLGSGVWQCDDPDDDCAVYRLEARFEAEHVLRWEPDNVLAECAAKRRLVEDYLDLDRQYKASHSEFTEARRFQALVALGQLALVYADHPEYEAEWRP